MCSTHANFGFGRLSGFFGTMNLSNPLRHSIDGQALGNPRTSVLIIFIHSAWTSCVLVLFHLILHGDSAATRRMNGHVPFWTRVRAIQSKTMADSILNAPG